MKRSRSLAAMGAAALLSSAALSSPSAAASSVASHRATGDRGHHPRHRRRAQTELATAEASSSTATAPTGAQSPPAAADDVDYHPSHALCPGYEERQLQGYATLSALRRDLELYYASFETRTPTGAPTSSTMPTTATKHPTSPPTYAPSLSPVQSPTANPTGSPSELPTKAPITLRPTPFPTSSIREERAPTKSPAPSIEMVIVGLPGGGGGTGGGGESGGGDGDEEEGELNWNFPPPPPENVPLDAPVDANGGMGAGMDGGAGFVGGPGGSYTGEAPEEDVPMEGAMDDGGERGMGGAGGRQRRLGHPTNARRRLQEAGAGMAANAADSQVIVEDGMAEEVGAAPESAAADGAAAPMTVDGEGTTTATVDEGKLDYTLSNEPSDGALVATTSENAAIPTASEDIPPVSFHLCPNSDFDFHDKFSLQGTLPPLRLETPSDVRPIEIRCMVIEGEEERNCVFRGGDVHLLFEHRPKLNNGDDEEGGEIGEVEHPITIRGITFRDAQTSSIRMNDPRGRVAFRNCAWEANEGTAAFVIDGTFNSTQYVLDNAGNEDDGGGQAGWGAAEDGKPTDTNNDSNSNNDSGGGVEVDEELSTTSSTLDWSIMMTSSTKSVDLVVEPDDFEDGRELFSTTTGSTTPARGRGLEYSNDEEELTMYGGREEEMMAMEDLDGMRDEMRRLEAADVPRSIVTVEGCSFKGNRGNATIMVSSRFEEQTLAEQDPGVLTHNDDLLNGDSDSDGGGRGRHLEGDEGSTTPLAHTVHLVLRDTTFSSEVVDTSVIENYGGRVQTTGCVFANNTAESIIRSESGTVAMSSTEFSMNDIKGEEGMVVLDEASALERDEDTCIRGTSGSDGGAAAPSSAASGGESPVVAKNASGTRMDSFNGARRLNGTAVEGGASGIRCEGIVSGGICTSFALCRDQEAGDATSNETSSPEMAESSCFSDWEALVAAVRDRPQNERDFIICPGAALVATEPVVIDADYITIQCGTEKAPSKNCIITGGFSHFHVVGSSSGVQLARLSMSSSSGASVLALGTADATLNLRDCEWTHNEGASAILIRNDAGLGAAVAGGGMQELVVMPMLAKSGGRAMAVEVTDCVFGKNDLIFGAIANVGGTLSVYKSKFAENSGRGGDIVVTNEGSCTVQGSCFDASSSVAPGVIFVQEGSVMNANTNNFGFGITAGGYTGDGTCTDAFLEVEGADCLGSSNCDGICLGFTATVCPVDVSGDESILGMADAGGGKGSGGGAGELVAAPEGQIFVPAYSRSEGSDGSSKIVPIVVAAIVCVFIVLGLVGIIVRRRKVASNNNVSPANDEPSSRGFCCCLKGRGAKRRESSAYEDVDDEGNDVFDEDDVA